MKKYLKSLFTFLVAFIAIGTVNAETTYKVEIKNANEGHTYEAYQIFKGDLSGDKLTLSNIKWGDNIDTAWQQELANDTENPMTANDYAKSITSANAKAKATELGSHLTGTAKGSSNTISNGTYTITGLAPGYYLVKDKDNSQNGNDDVYTEYIVKLVGDTEVTPKTGKPTADKKIDEGNGVTYSSNYAIGDHVPYVLTGTLPANYDSYTTYKYVFHDKLSAGLTLDTNTVKVYVDGTEITSGFTVNTSPSDGDSLDVVFADTKTISAITASSVITVKYTATVNSDAVRGTAGNENTLNIEFSNNPYSDNTGKTGNVITKVYIFDLILNKIDSETLAALKGAGFTLTRKSDKKSWTINNADGNVFKFEGLGVGEYTLEETTTPDKYNTISPITFTISAVYDETTGELTDLEISQTGYTFTITVAEDSATLEADIPNVKGIELPYTGGTGTIIFTVVGLAIMAVAAVGFFKKNEE